MIQPPEIKNIYFAHEADAWLQKWAESQSFSQVFVLCDQHTYHHCFQAWRPNVPFLASAQVLLIPPGEASKSSHQLQLLWSALSQAGADRHSLLINVGGGITTDLGGLLAATYMRGIPFVQVPTSLLAMADAAVGGKTGINHSGAKNRVGAFAAPAAVLIRPAFLDTLPPAEWYSGRAEMLKHGLMGDAAHFHAVAAVDFEQRRMPLELLRHTLALKQAVVAQDPREQGPRKKLNLGHTLGHALESYYARTEQPLRHGHAVALGLQVALALSVKHLGLSRGEAEEALQRLRADYPWPAVPAPWAALEPLLRGDKKNKGTEIRMVLLPHLGEAQADISLPAAELRAALEKVRAAHAL